jgi:hypothetical protein
MTIIHMHKINLYLIVAIELLRAYLPESYLYRDSFLSFYPGVNDTGAYILKEPLFRAYLEGDEIQQCPRGC